MFQKVFGTTIGYSHLSSHKPCQDSGIWEDRDGIIVFGVADGHGDERCFRSDRGSRFAVEVSKDALYDFYNTLECNLLDKNRFLNSVNFQKELMHHLFQSIVSKWRTKVLTDYQADPVHDKVITDIKKAYGTTLMIGIMTSDYLLLLQQGDGHVFVFDDKLNYSLPIPWDEECVSNVTTSLCDNDAENHFRYKLITDIKNILAVFAGSDGVEDSFSSLDSTANNYYLPIIDEIATLGLFKENQKLSEDLADLSKKGSHDDITISGIVDADKILSVKDFIHNTYCNSSKKRNITQQIENIDSKLTSSKRKYETLEKLFATNSYNEYLQLKEERKNLAEEKERLLRELSELDKPTPKEEIEITIPISDENEEIPVTDSMNNDEPFNKKEQTNVDEKLSESTIEPTIEPPKEEQSITDQHTLEDKLSLQENSQNSKGIPTKSKP